MKTKQRNKPTRDEAVPVGSTCLVAVAYGGGTNSTAMLCGMLERGIKPDLITFADTGAEMPHTYKHLEVMKGKVREWWGMEIVTVRKLYQGKFEGLNGQCLRRGELPGLAYATRSCSIKYKGQPQDDYLQKWMDANGLYRVPVPSKIKQNGPKAIAEHIGDERGSMVKAIGFGADEAHRRNTLGYRPDLYRPWYPLVEWNWRRVECVEAIARHGIQQPGKYACYFCPASKRSEVIRLNETYPELMAEALEIERLSQANNKTKRGLGGENNMWADWLAMDEAQGKLMLDIEPVHMPCGCIDG